KDLRTCSALKIACCTKDNPKGRCSEAGAISKPLVGSGTGAVASARPAEDPVPAPATSHVACGFPALRVPAHFTTRVMRPIRTGHLPRRAVDKPLGTHRKVRGFHTAIPCATASIRSLDA